MAKEQKTKTPKEVPNAVPKKPVEEKREERVVRILSRDIEGKMKLYPGLTKIKGVSWGISNAACKILSIDKNKKIGALTEDEIKKITEFLKNPKIPTFLVNRRFDLETGERSEEHTSELQSQFHLL